MHRFVKRHESVEHQITQDLLGILKSSFSILKEIRGH